MNSHSHLSSFLNQNRVHLLPSIGISTSLKGEHRIFSCVQRDLIKTYSIKFHCLTEQEDRDEIKSSKWLPSSANRVFMQPICSGVTRDLLQQFKQIQSPWRTRFLSDPCTAECLQLALAPSLQQSHTYLLTELLSKLVTSYNLQQHNHKTKRKSPC